MNMFLRKLYSKKKIVILSLLFAGLFANSTVFAGGGWSKPVEPEAVNSTTESEGTNSQEQYQSSENIRSEENQNTGNIDLGESIPEADKDTDAEKASYFFAKNSDVPENDEDKQDKEEQKTEENASDDQDIFRAKIHEITEDSDGEIIDCIEVKHRENQDTENLNSEENISKDTDKDTASDVQEDSEKEQHKEEQKTKQNASDDQDEEEGYYSCDEGSEPQESSDNAMPDDEDEMEEESQQRERERNQQQTFSGRDRFERMRNQQESQEPGEEIDDLLKFYEQYFEGLREEYGDNPELVERYLKAMREDQVLFEDKEEPSEEERSFFEERFFRDSKPESEQEKVLANKIIEFFALKYPKLKEKYESNPDNFAFELKDKDKLENLIEKLNKVEREKGINENSAPRTIDLEDAVIFYDKEEYRKLTTPRREGRFALDSGALLIGVDLSKIKLLNVHLEHSILIGANFKGNKRLKTIYFQYADLSNSKFDESKPNDCDFSYANLTNASFTESHVRGQFSEVILLNTKFNKTVIYDSTFAGIKHCDSDFSESLIQDTRFAAVEFNGANMSETIIIGAAKEMVFDQCDFFNVNFTESVWKNVYFKNTSIACFMGGLFTADILVRGGSAAAIFTVLPSAGVVAYVAGASLSIKAFAGFTALVMASGAPVLVPFGVAAFGVVGGARFLRNCCRSNSSLNCKTLKNITRVDHCIMLNPDNMDQEAMGKFEQLGAKIVDDSFNISDFLLQFAASSVASFATAGARYLFGVN